MSLLARINLKTCLVQYVRSICFSQSLDSNAQKKSELIVFTNNGTAVCWHPEPEFPYEFSKPLPAEIPCIQDPVLKVDVAKALGVFRKKKAEEVVTDLARVTYTTKHRWYPKSRTKKIRKMPPERPYL